jgi:hypothetical protein
MKRLLALATNPHSYQLNPDLPILKEKVKGVKRKSMGMMLVQYTSFNCLKDHNSNNKNFLVNN